MFHNDYTLKLKGNYFNLVRLWLVLITISFQSCITTYSFTKPELNDGNQISGSIPILFQESDHRWTTAMYSNKILGEIPKKKDGVIVKIKSEKLISSNFKFLNALSYLTLCLIPCLYESNLELELNYDAYSIVEKKVTEGYWPMQRTSIQKVVEPKKTLLTEKINYSINQTGFFLAYADHTLENTIYRKISKNANSDDQEKTKLASKLKVFSSYLSNKLTELEKINTEESLRLDQELTGKLSKIKANDCQELHSFHADLEESKTELREKAWEKFETCINSKTKKFALKKYPFLKDFIDNEIFFWNQTSEYFLHELFHSSFLSIIPESQYKLRDEEFNFSKVSPSKFNINILTGRELIVIEFEKKGKTLYCNSIKSRSEVNPSGWEEVVKELFKKSYTYPQKADHWDWDLISKY